MKIGDVITQVDGQAISDESVLGDVLLSKKSGTVVSVQVYRGKQLQTVRVPLAELPNS